MYQGDNQHQSTGTSCFVRRYQLISLVRVGLPTLFAVPRLLDLRKRELAGRALETWALVPALPQGFQEKDLGYDPFPTRSFSSSQWRRSSLHQQLPSAQGQSWRLPFHPFSSQKKEKIFSELCPIIKVYLSIILAYSNEGLKHRF